MKNILIINTYYYPNNIGGAESVVQNLAEGLSRKGYDVAVYSSDGKEKMKKELINGVTVYRSVKAKYVRQPAHNRHNPLSIRIRNNINHRMNIFMKKELRYVLDDFKPDIVHTHNLYGFSTQVWRYCKKEKYPLVHTIHDYWLLNSSIYMWAKRNSSFPDYITAPSNFVINKFKKQKYFECMKYKMIPNGININILETRRIIEKKLNREEKKIKFLYVGQIEKIKGIDILLNTFTNWENKEVELGICGQGNLADLAEEFSKKDSRICFYGQLPKKRLNEIYEESDILVVPSVWDEPFGMVAIEAYQHGLVVIAGKRGGLIEIVENINVGCLIDPESEVQLLEAMKKYTDRNRIKKEIQKIPETLKVYTLDKQIGNYCDVYEQILMYKK